MINLVRNSEGYHVVMKRWISSYVTRLGWNCYLSTWMTTMWHAKNTCRSEMRYFRHVLKIELVGPEMHKARG